MDCGIPFCHEGCPLGNLIPEWNDLVYRDDWREAIERLHATNNFPEFTGRLCPAPCEAACVLGINDDPVTIKRIEYEIVERAWDEAGSCRVPPRCDRQDAWPSSARVRRPGRRAAAGPRRARRDGLRAGRAAGGLLRYGIPEFKMEKAVLDRRLAQMRAEGSSSAAASRWGQPAPEVNRGRRHRDVTVVPDRIRCVRRTFDAVVLAGGATAAPGPAGPGPGPRRRPPGDGVPEARRTGSRRGRLADVARSPPRASAVVIIGGGDTGADCLGTAHRQGAASVHQFEIMPRAAATPAPSDNPWPTWPLIFRTSAAHEEGGERVFAVTTEEFSATGRRGSGPARRRGRDGHRRRRAPGFDPVAGKRVRAALRPGAAGHGLLGPERHGVVARARASSSTPVATWPATRAGRPASTGCSSAAT